MRLEFEPPLRPVLRGRVCRPGRADLLCRARAARARRVDVQHAAGKEHEVQPREAGQLHPQYLLARQSGPGRPGQPRPAAGRVCSGERANPLLRPAATRLYTASAPRAPACGADRTRPAFPRAAAALQPERASGRSLLCTAALARGHAPRPGQLLGGRPSWWPARRASRAVLSGRGASSPSVQLRKLQHQPAGRRAPAPAGRARSLRA
mmetsp:Transcript_18747/g.61821  ORF Transcript_18747/g.61821 Transcript_18747/m.61821 type:complete len:208 (+) Transcript_18747:438-1061(+)